MMSLFFTTRAFNQMFYIVFGLCYPVWHRRKAQLLPFDGILVPIHITCLELSEKEDNISFTQITGHRKVQVNEYMYKNKKCFCNAAAFGCSKL